MRPLDVVAVRQSLEAQLPLHCAGIHLCHPGTGVTMQARGVHVFHAPRPDRTALSCHDYSRQRSQISDSSMVVRTFRAAVAAAAAAPRRVHRPDSKHRNKPGGRSRCAALRAWLVAHLGDGFLSHGAGVLDVGGGRGEFAVQMSNMHGVRTTIIDPRQPAMLKFWRRLLVRSPLRLRCLPLLVVACSVCTQAAACGCAERGVPPQPPLQPTCQPQRGSLPRGPNWRFPHSTLFRHTPH